MMREPSCFNSSKHTWHHHFDIDERVNLNWNYDFPITGKSYSLFRIETVSMLFNQYQRVHENQRNENRFHI